MTRIGWIGTGAMGAPMARRLAAAGHEVAAYDVDATRVGALGDAGVRAAVSPAEAATKVEVLALMVATPAQVAAVLEGEAGALAGLDPGTLVVLMATVGPESARRFGEAVAAHAAELLDAPVSGGVRRAGTGELLAMVGGPPALVERGRAFLDELASTVSVAGPEVGDGQKMKLVNQLLAGVHIAVAGEALAFAEAIGLDPLAAFEVVRHGAAASFMLEDRGDRMTRAAFDDVRSALDIWVKDMGLVTAAAKAADFPSPLAATAEQLYLAGRRAGLGRFDDSIVYEVARGRTERA